MASGKTGRLQETLRYYCASRGYLDARIGELRTSYDNDSGELRVAIPIEEGAVLVVSRVELLGADSLSETRLRQQLRSSEGRPFNLSDFIHNRSALSSFYRREGFSQARIESRFERRGQDLEVLFQIEEGARSRIGNVKVVGNRRTRTSTIERELVFKDGDPIRISDFTQSQRRLYELGVFRSADVRVESSETAGLESDVIVEVSEVSDLAFNYGARYEAESGLELQTETQAPNLFGGAQHASLTTRFSSKGSLVRTTFRTPYLSGLRLDTDVFFAWETDEEDFADTSSWSFTFQQTRRLKEKLGAQWSSTFKRTHTAGKVITGPFSFDFTVDRVFFTASVFEDTRNSVLNPLRGRFWNLTFQAAPSSLGSDIRFAKLFGQLYAFWPLSSEVVWASSYRLGLSQGFGQVLLPEDRFRAGGATTVRGFAQDGLGPVDPVTDTNIGGEALVVFNQEIRFPVYRWFGGAAFYDAGNVFLDLEDFNPIDLRHSAGFGLRVERSIRHAETRLGLGARPRTMGEGQPFLVYLRTYFLVPDLESSLTSASPLSPAFPCFRRQHTQLIRTFCCLAANQANADRVLLTIFAVEILLRVASYRPPRLEVFKRPPIGWLRTRLLARRAFLLQADHARQHPRRPGVVPRAARLARAAATAVLDEVSFI